MMPDEIEQLVQEQIAGRWSESNDHGIDLHFSLVTPTQIKVIEWRVKDGRSMESLLAVWLLKLLLWYKLQVRGYSPAN